MSALLASDRLASLDFVSHNAEVKEVWDRINQRRPIRVPVILGTNTRYFLLGGSANEEGMDFQRYIECPGAMFRTQLRFQRWSRFNLLQDAELGLPEAWSVGVDLQNFYEAAWLGCPIEYLPGQVPDTRPIYRDNPERLIDQGIPDPFSGWLGRAADYEDRFRELAEGYEYMGRPVHVHPGTGMGTDGPFTAACNLCGPEFVCLELMENPERIQRLLAFLTEAIVVRIKAWMHRWGVSPPVDGCGIADDSVAMLSVAHYREHVLPHHRRYFEALGTSKGHGIHLCGNATHLFPTLVQELGIQSFDTGFPVDFGALRRTLGPDIQIQGGPHVEFLLSRSPAEVREEVRRILESGIMDGGRFMLREGNNLAPGTPLENTEAMVLAGREFGRYD